MVNLTTIRTIMGLSFNLLGLTWSITDKIICDILCDGECGVVQSNNCSLLFLFVGIIFIVCGYVLIVMKDRQKIKLRKKLKKNLVSILRS